MKQGIVCYGRNEEKMITNENTIFSRTVNVTKSQICVLSSKESIDQANQVRRDMFMKAQGICVRSSLAQMERVYYDQVDNFNKAFNSLNEHLRRQSHVFLHRKLFLMNNEESMDQFLFLFVMLHNFCKF
ncbi:hypothetical protein ACP275_08G193700 [Erythranthe tilingii]